MRIDGKKIAEGIRKNLHKQIGDLIAKGITPKLAIITLGDESSWENYIRQKIKVADQLGIKTVLLNLKDSNEQELLKVISEVDSDPLYHGIIVQRPMPAAISKDKVINSISPEKDVDGFRPDSKFEVPVWMAVRCILLSVFGNQLSVNSHSVISQSVSELENRKLEDWNLKTENGQQITDLAFVVLGKGETAGGPIARGLAKMGVEPTIIDSQTENRDDILKNADVVISCVGKSETVKADQIKFGSILIGVGTHNQNGNINGDYIEDQIESIARFYTPTPGGVGPINLAYLFTNLVKAAEMI